MSRGWGRGDTEEGCRGVLTVAPKLLVQEGEAAGERQRQAHAARPGPHVLAQEVAQGALGTRGHGDGDGDGGGTHGCAARPAAPPSNLQLG